MNPKLNLLCCPKDRMPLAFAEARVLSRLQASAKAGELRTVTGRVINERFDGALVRSDRKIAYLVIDGIARLVADEDVLLENLSFDL